MSKMKVGEKRSTLTSKLRFPEFREMAGWKEKTLWEIADPVSERAAPNGQNNILTLSAEQGIVLQSEYFARKIAGTDTERYTRVKRDDFVYNDRTTKASEFGTIKRLTQYAHGIVSPIYKCFRFKGGELPCFWEWYFASGAHDSELRSLANEGARTGRFNVSIDTFLSTRVWAPGLMEQERIALCLSSMNDLIAAQSAKLKALKNHQKGLMQQLFPDASDLKP